MSDSRELPNITGFDTSLFLCVFLSFLRIQQVPKTATEPSPICQALRSARRLGHPSFVLYFYFAYQRTLLLCARAAGSKLMPTNWKKKTSSHSVLNFLKTLISPPPTVHASARFCHGPPSFGGDKTLRAKAVSETALHLCFESSFHVVTKRTEQPPPPVKGLIFFLSAQSVNITKTDPLMCVFYPNLPPLALNHFFSKRHPPPSFSLTWFRARPGTRSRN